MNLERPTASTEKNSQDCVRLKLEASISSKGMEVVRHRDVKHSLESAAESEPEELPVGFATRAGAENPGKVIVQYVKITSWNGERYAFAGVGSTKNDWAIPCRAFRIEDIVGQYLLKLEESCDGSGLVVQRDATKKPLLSNAPVSAFISNKDEIRTYGELSAIAKGEVVFVDFGFEKLKECYEEVPPLDVTEVKTPRTPSPEHSL